MTRSVDARGIVRRELRPRLAWWLLPSAMIPADLGYFGFFVTCPAGHLNFVGADLDQVRVTNAHQNFVTSCEVCGAQWDVAPAGDVEISTRGGRLRVRQVAQALRDLRDVVRQADPAEVSTLREALLEGAELQPERFSGALGDWLRAHPEMVRHATEALLALMVGLLLLWVEHSIFAEVPSPPPAPDQQPIIVEHLEVTVDHDPSDAELEQWVKDALRGAGEDG